jgi:hypothetical protein
MSGRDLAAITSERAAARPSELRLRDGTAAVADWTWEADATGRFTWIAEQARAFGVDPARLIGLDRLTEQDTEDAIARRREVLARRKPFHDLGCRYGREGFTFVFMLHGVPIHGMGCFAATAAAPVA